MKLNRVSALFLFALSAAVSAQTSNPKITAEDLSLCKNEIAEWHRREILYIKKEVRDYCTKGPDTHYAAESCKNQSEWLTESSGTSNLTWFMKGNDHCEGSDYPCFGLQLYNEGNPPEDLIRADATEPSRPDTGDLWGYQGAEKCVSKIWVAKRDGKSPAAVIAGTVKLSSSSPVNASSAANKNGGASIVASSAGAGSSSTASTTRNSSGTDRQRKVHNPAADAKGCVKLIQDAAKPGAGTSGNWRFGNECNSSVEIFWCFVDSDSKCKNGGTWTVSAGKGWPTFGNQAIKWGACRGRDGGGFNRESNGDSYTCELLKW